MRILIATGIFPPDIGGPAVYTKLIAGEFSAFGHKVIVVTYADSRNSKFEARNSKQYLNSKFQILNVSRKLPKGIRHLVYFWKVFWYGLKADVIYAQDPVSAGLPVCIAVWFLRKPFVLKVVGDYAWEQGRNRFGVKDLLDEFLQKKYGLRVQFLRFVESQVAKRAKAVITPSNYLKSVVEKWGVRPVKINVVYNSVSLPKLPSKEECRQELGLEGRILVSVGRLVPWKGFDALIKLMPKIVGQNPEAKLFIIGDGPERKALRSQIANRKSQDSIMLTGNIAHEGVLKYLRAADIFLLNTGYEGFSHQILEAMAAGIPVITTDAGGNKEIVRDRENALVAKYNSENDWQEKILKLLADKSLQEKLSENAKKEASQYTKEKMINETIKVLQS